MSFLSQIRFCFIPVTLSTYPTKIDLMKSKKPTGCHTGPTSRLFWYDLFFVHLCYIGLNNDFYIKSISDCRKIDKFKLSIRKVPKTSDYSDKQLAKSLKRFEIRLVT